MKFKTLAASTAFGTIIALSSSFAFAADLTVVSWGGAYTKSQIEAYQKPWMAKTGKTIISVDYDGNVAPIKAQVQAGDVTWDVVDVSQSDAIRLCDDGLLDPINPKILPPAPNGTPATKDFLKGALQSCAVGNIVWSTVYGYNTTKFKNKPPKTIADFFDVKNFPGKRGMRKAPKGNLEFALMASGVPTDEVYATLKTKKGVDKAFAELDKIKKDVVWWEAGAQAPQLLADGQVSMTTAYNGRLFNAIVTDHQPFKIVWDGQILKFDMWVIPKNAPHKANALNFVKFSTSTQALANQAKWISYGPARKSSASLIGMSHDGKTNMKPNMPTAPQHMKNALVNNAEFWADNGDSLSERFNAWLAK